MGITFEGVDCLQGQIIKEKYHKRKESVSLDNNNHKETYVTHRRKQDKGNL